MGNMCAYLNPTHNSLEVIVVDADLVVGGSGGAAARVREESNALVGVRGDPIIAASYGVSHAVATEQVVARRRQRSSSIARDAARAIGQGGLACVEIYVIKETMKMFMIYFSRRKRAFGACGI